MLAKLLTYYSLNYAGTLGAGLTTSMGLAQARPKYYVCLLCLCNIVNKIATGT